MSNANLTEIKIDHVNRTCMVTMGQARRTFYSTPQAVGVALLSGSRLEESHAEAARNVEWVDHLATHGLAVGTRRGQQFELMVIQAKARTIRYNDASISVTFPPMLIGMQLVDGRFRNAILMLADITRLSSFGVVSTTPVLAAFPYGNVYTSGHICWGNVRHSDIHTIADLEALFFGSGFNTDLFDGGTAGISQLREGVLPVPRTERFTTTFPTAIQRLISGRQ